LLRPRFGNELTYSTNIVAVVVFMPSETKAGATTPEALSVQDTDTSSDMEESVPVSVQASQDAKTTLDPSESDAKNLDEIDQNDHDPLLTQGNEESSSEQSPPFVFWGGKKLSTSSRHEAVTPLKERSRFPQLIVIARCA